MRKAILMSCCAIAALASCSTGGSQPWPGAGPPNPKQIGVGVAGGAIQIEPITTVAAANGAVLWELDQAAAANFRFPTDGARFDYPAPNAPKICRSTPDPKEAFDLPNCKPTANGKHFVCPRKPNHLPGACYKYTVTLQRTSPGVGVPPKDPWIMNEE
jgi:hypothetical protein